MVVIQSQPSTSAHASRPRKNRRRTSKKAPRLAQAEDNEMPAAEAKVAQDDELMIDVDPSPSQQPTFPEAPLDAHKTTLKSETRRIPIPPHRMTPLKKDWINIFGPLTEVLGLQVRMNIQRRCVEARVRKMFTT